MSKQLKPCPKCGSKKMTMFKTCYPKKLKKFHVECDKCHYCCGENTIFAFSAVRKWNKEKRKYER